jgi:hypothetical protein
MLGHSHKFFLFLNVMNMATIYGKLKWKRRAVFSSKEFRERVDGGSKGKGARVLHQINV